MSNKGKTEKLGKKDGKTKPKPKSKAKSIPIPVELPLIEIGRKDKTIRQLSNEFKKTDKAGKVIVSNKADTMKINGNVMLYPYNIHPRIAQPRIEERLDEWKKENKIKRKIFGDERAKLLSRFRRELLKEQTTYLNQYQKDDQIPFYNPRNAIDVINPNRMKTDLPKVFIAYEKAETIKKPSEKVLEEFGYTKAEISAIKKKLDKGKSTSGNKIQTQVFPKSVDRKTKYEFSGLFTQNDANPSRDKPFPTLYNPEFIAVDDDNIGHLIAYQLNMYAHKKPFNDNVYIGKSKFWNPKAKPTSVNPVRVNRALGKSVIDSINTRQNGAIIDAITDANGGVNVLKYRDADGKTKDIKPSKQLVQMVDRIHEDMREIKLEVYVSDRSNPIIFPYKVHLFEETTPTLEFDLTKQVERQRTLDSDMLLRAAVRRYDLEPDSVQRILENLNNQGWITYPRTEKEKAEAEDVDVRLEDNVEIIDSQIWQEIEVKEGRKIVRREKRLFKGTNVERNILELVIDAHSSFEKDTDFLIEGNWILKSGEKELISETDFLISGDEIKYTDDQFDIRLGEKRGITPESLTVYLTKNKIGTPATRTAQLARLKNAGMITLQNDRYVLDQRALYLVSAHKVLDELQLLEQYDLAIGIVAESKDAKEISQVINDYQIVDRDFYAEWIKKFGDAYVEAEDDLAYLEEF